jgi:hypothetical protein
MSLAKVMVASVVVALGLAASAAAMPTQSSGGTDCARLKCPAGKTTRHLYAGAEFVQAACAVEYGFSGSMWEGAVFTSDTPPFPAIGPELGPYFAFGSGTAIFTPSGNFEVECHGLVDLTRSPPFNGRGFCGAVRGGDEFSHGAKSYSGEGELVVTPDGKVTIGCHGSFRGILP